MKISIGDVGVALCIAMTPLFLGCARADAGKTVEVSASRLKAGAIPYADDATISAGVKDILVTESAAIAYQVTVKTVNGSVHLSGIVNTVDDRNKVVALTRAIPGVRAIENELTVEQDNERG